MSSLTRTEGGRGVPSSIDWPTKLIKSLCRADSIASRKRYLSSRRLDLSPRFGSKAKRSKLFLRTERGYKPSSIPRRQIILQGIARIGSMEQKVTPPVINPPAPAREEKRSSSDLVRKDLTGPRLNRVLKFVRFCSSRSSYNNWCRVLYSVSEVSSASNKFSLVCSRISDHSLRECSC